MKRTYLLLVVTILSVTINSCNDPETVVTNIVHTDGSVTRKIEIRNKKNDFSRKDLQIPFDSTWTVRDSVEINPRGDTTWIKRGEKSYPSVDYMNAEYRKDSSYNRSSVRRASFHKQFRWFNTDYLFAEEIDRNLRFGYPVSQFLDKDELNYYYLPFGMKNELRYGGDSLKYKTLEDSINKRTDRWTKKSLIAEWIGEFDILTPGRTEKELGIDVLKSKGNEFETIADKYSKDFDSLWSAGIVLRDMFGEVLAKKYKSQADSAMSTITRKMLLSFKEYTMKIVMPGKLTGTNGFPDSSHVLQWPVKFDFFFTEPYRMWAESKTTNTWAWIVTGLFLVFVITGLIIRRVKKQDDKKVEGAFDTPSPNPVK